MTSYSQEHKSIKALTFKSNFNNNKIRKQL